MKVKQCQKSVIIRDIFCEAWAEDDFANFGDDLKMNVLYNVLYLTLSVPNFSPLHHSASVCRRGRCKRKGRKVAAVSTASALSL